MRAMRAFFLRLGGCFRGGESDLGAELESHLELHVADNLRAGMTQDEARREALLRLGGVAWVTEACRERRGLPFLDRLAQDLRYGLRQLRRSPAFTAAVVGSLALGIGANTAIFSILNALLLKSLPVAAPHELFLVHQQARGVTPQRFSYPMFLRLRDAATGAEGVAGMSHIARAQVRIEAASEAETASVQLVSGEFFPLLGVPAALGRTLAPGDNRTPGANPVAVIGYGYWQSRFAGSPDVLGRRLMVNGVAFTIVGVAQRGFQGVWVDSPVAVWVPLAMQADVRYSQNFSSHNTSEPEKPWVPQEFIDWLDLIVRAKPAAAPATREALNGVFLGSLEIATGSFGPETRRYFLERSLTLEPFGRGLSSLRDRFASPLLALMAMVALVLLIACANAANLLLARAEGRRREIAVRLSIGASRARLVQQFLAEGFLVVAAAAGIGLLLAGWIGDVLVRMALGVTAGPTPLGTGLDWNVLAFTAALSVVTAFLFGLAPALRATRPDLASAMKSASRTAAWRSARNPGKFLVAAQVALSLLVVFGAGLFARSLRNLSHLPLGFEPEHVLSVRIDPRAGGFAGAQLDALYHRLMERVQAVPGVRSAAVSNCGLAVECRSSSDVRLPGYVPQPLEQMRAQYSFVSPGYFATVGTALRDGRDFEGRDRGNRSAVVNEAFTRRYFPRGAAVGQRFGIKGMDRDSEIIGEIRDARVNRVREAAVPMVYYPLEGNVVYAESLEVRAAGDPKTVSTDVRKALSSVASGLPVTRIATLTEQVDRSLNQERLTSRLTLAFGILALGLACFGLYGVMSWTVARRTSEIGVRMALGAQPAAVLGAVLKEVLGLIALGLAVGVPGVFFGARAVTTLLYEVPPNDPATFLGAALVLVTSGIAAGFVPAWRAARVDPVLALRHE